MTGAAHRFAPGPSNVYHPKTTGQRIGKIGKVLGTSDVALFKLKAGLKYSDTTFSSEDYKVSPFYARLILQLFLEQLLYSSIHHSMDLSQVRHRRSLVFGHPLVIAYTQRWPNARKPLCTLLGVRLGLIPADEPGQEHQYIMGTVIKFGGNADQILPGFCDAYVWTDDFEVVGQS